MFHHFRSQWGGTAGAAFQAAPSVQLHSASTLLSSHVEVRAQCDYNLITRAGNFHINGEINEEYYLTSNWGVWSIWMCVTLGAEVALPLFDSNYTPVERRGEGEWSGVVRGLSEDQSLKPAAFPWTPGGSGVPACFWE